MKALIVETFSLDLSRRDTIRNPGVIGDVVDILHFGKLLRAQGTCWIAWQPPIEFRVVQAAKVETEGAGSRFECFAGPDRSPRQALLSNEFSRGAERTQA